MLRLIFVVLLFFLGSHSFCSDMAQIESPNVKALLRAVNEGGSMAEIDAWLSSLIKVAQSPDGTEEEMLVASTILIDDEEKRPLGFCRRNPKLGLSIVEKAEAKGSFEAAAILAKLHGYGGYFWGRNPGEELSIQPNLELALSYLKKHNLAQSKFLMGVLYQEEGSKCDLNTHKVNCLKKSIRDSQYIIKGMRLIIAAANEGCPEARTSVENDNLREELSENLQAWHFGKFKATDDYQSALQSF